VAFFPPLRSAHFSGGESICQYSRIKRISPTSLSANGNFNDSLGFKTCVIRKLPTSGPINRVLHLCCEFCCTINGAGVDRLSSPICDVWPDSMHSVTAREPRFSTVAVTSWCSRYFLEGTSTRTCAAVKLAAQSVSKKPTRAASGMLTIMLYSQLRRACKFPVQ
jgi:hypothetical protein